MKEPLFLKPASRGPLGDDDLMLIGELFTSCWWVWAVKRCLVSSRRGSKSIGGVIGIGEVGAGQVGEMRVGEL